jgi:hypothetical protein
MSTHAYDIVREWNNGIPADADCKRMSRERDWAPAAGTSHVEHERLCHALDTEYRQALGDMAEQIPGLTATRLEPGRTTIPCLEWDDEPGENGCYWVSCGIEHRGGWPPEALRTYVMANYLTEEEGSSVYPLNLYLTGDGARDGRVLAAMVIAAVREHHETVAGATAT